MSLIAVLSPAKRLDFQGAERDLPYTDPDFTAQARTLIALARQWTPRHIAAAMKLSENLAALNHQRYQDFDTAYSPHQAALFAFAGDVYAGLDAPSLSDEQAMAANDRLRILSGLYGLLRPLDRIQPYRLEMGTAIQTPQGKTLYDFWGADLAQALNQSGATTLINLASQEYWGAVDQTALSMPVLTCHFKEMRDGKPKIISFNAKRARGLMARYLVDQAPETIEDLRGFAAEGYAFAPDLSDESNMTFLKTPK